ncbi:MAG: hypothetical protein ACTSYJ_06330 [Candidatus Thorarchaeota archaeon]
MRYLMIEYDAEFGIVETQDDEDVEVIGKYQQGHLNHVLNILKHIAVYYVDRIEIGFIEKSDGNKLLMVRPDNGDRNCWIAVAPWVEDE